MKNRRATGDVVMVQARIHKGRVEVQDPIPKEWEGQHVKISPLTPDEPLPDLEQRLAVLQALGPIEMEPGERELIGQMMAELDRLSRDARQKSPGSQS